MGETAEEVQLKYGITREDQDLFAFNSHQKAIKAQDPMLLSAEIVPVEVKKEKRAVYF